MSHPQVLVAGEALVDLFPADDGDPVATDTFQRRAGGAPANVAVALGKLDVPPRLWTSVGDDAFGAYLESTLEDSSIDTQFVTQCENASTGIALVDDTVEGGFELYLDGTAAVEFDIDELPKTVFTDVEWVHLGGVLLAREPARSAMFDLLDRADAHDCTVSFDPNVRPSIWPSTDECVDTLERVVDVVDVVIGHVDDFPPEAFPDDPEHLADELLDRGVSAALVTKGAAGAEGKTRADSRWGAQYHQHPGFDVDVVDTTGAGDAFTAAAIASLRETDSLSDVLPFANACGAITTTQTGAIAALPDRAAVTTWLSEHAHEQD